MNVTLKNWNEDKKELVMPWGLKRKQERE